MYDELLFKNTYVFDNLQKLSGKVGTLVYSENPDINIEQIYFVDENGVWYLLLERNVDYSMMTPKE